MPPTLKRPVDELAEIQSRSALLFERKLLALAEATLFDGGDARRQRLAGLAQLIGESMTLADLIGRKRLLMEFDRHTDDPEPEDQAPEILTFADTPVVPHVPFGEAVDDIVSREPRLALGWRAVADLYKRAHAFALAKSADASLTTRVQKMIQGFLRTGKTVAQAAVEITREGVLNEIRGWTRAYADTVYETNIATAYAAGRARQAKDPDIRRVMAAFRYVSALLESTRPNHRAAHGLVAGVDDPVWEAIYPPNGHRCRCAARLVSKSELRRMNLLSDRGAVMRSEPAGFEAAHRDEGFGGGRPDRRIYGGA